MPLVRVTMIKGKSPDYIKKMSDSIYEALVEAYQQAEGESFQIGLLGMAKAFEEQRQQPAVASLTFEERLGLLVDREAVERETKRLVTRLKFANLRQNATIEDLNTKAARGLDKALFAKLATGDWIGRRQDLLI